MRTLALLLALLAPLALRAGPIAPREGWVVLPTRHAYADLLTRLEIAVKEADFLVVTRVGPTEAAHARGITLPGNMVFGVFRNDYAVRILGLSTAAMIEAPLRFYVTENPDRTATLSWKRPSFVFAPYLEEGGADLAAAASELDRIFDQIGRTAAGE